MCNSLTLTPNQMLSDFYNIFLEKGKKLGKPERDHMNKLIEVRQVQLVAAAIRACDPVMNVVLKELSLELSMAVKQLTTPDLSGKQCLQTDYHSVFIRTLNSPSPVFSVVKLVMFNACVLERLMAYLAPPHSAHSVPSLAILQIWVVPRCVTLVYPQPRLRVVTIFICVTILI